MHVPRGRGGGGERGGGGGTRGPDPSSIFKGMSFELVKLCDPPRSEAGLHTLIKKNLDLCMYSIS